MVDRIRRSLVLSPSGQGEIDPVAAALTAQSLAPRPAFSNTQGFSRMGKAAIGALTQGAVDRKDREQKAAISEKLAAAGADPLVAALARVNPKAAIGAHFQARQASEKARLAQQLAQQKANQPRPIPAGATVFDPKSRKGIFTAPAKPPAPGQFQRLLELGGVDPKSETGQAMVRDAIKRQTQPRGPLVKLEQTEQTAEQKGVGGFFADTFKEAVQAGDAAQESNARLGRVKQILSNVQTGRLKPVTSTAKSIARDLGIPLESLGIQDDTPFAEALSSLAGQLTLDSVRRTKGAVSDKEMALFGTIAPGLNRTVEGNLLIVEMVEKMNKQARDVAQLALDYRRRNGRIDEGFFEEKQRYFDQNPLFSAELTNKVNQTMGGGLTGAIPNLPQGSIMIGTQNGRPVFQLPDGQKVVVEE